MQYEIGRTKSVFLDSTLHAKLQLLRAFGKEKTIQHIVDKAVEEYLERHHKQTLECIARVNSNGEL